LPISSRHIGKTSKDILEISAVLFRPNIFRKSHQSVSHNSKMFLR